MAECDPFEHALKMLDAAILVEKQPDITMPYPGEKYNYVEDENYIYVEGWRGDMVIGKIASHSFVESIIKPIINKDTSFYAMIRKNDIHGDNETVYTILSNCKVDFHRRFKDYMEVGLHSSCFHVNTAGKWTFKGMQRACKDAMNNISCVTLYNISNHPKSKEYQGVITAILNPYSSKSRKYFRKLL